MGRGFAFFCGSVFPLFFPEVGAAVIFVHGVPVFEKVEDAPPSGNVFYPASLVVGCAGVLVWLFQDTERLEAFLQAHLGEVGQSGYGGHHLTMFVGYGQHGNPDDLEVFTVLPPDGAPDE